MIHLSSIYSPTEARRGSVFSARQYPRQAFENLIDPVLNIDWFEMSGPTFPPHPHAGFSAVTYLFADSPNGFVNRDSLGEVKDILPGGLHWSRAARGLMHEEAPIPGEGPVQGLQIFINLPSKNQDDPAAAFPVPAAMMTQKSGVGWKSRIAVDGTALGEAKHALPSPVRIEEIAMDGTATRHVEVPEGWGGILVVLEGEVSVASTSLNRTQAIGFAADSDDRIEISPLSGPSRLAIISGKQLRQPVFSYGPLMLASAALLDEARQRVASLTL